jgi:glucans biosynthesis protein C
MPITPSTRAANVASAAPAPLLPSRLYFLDWVRIIAFFVLILFHVGMVYVSWDFHVKSPFASDAAEWPMMLSSPWRLALLFLVAGAASRMMLGAMPVGRFARGRSWRLLLPLLFGMLVIVPPQSYCEVLEKFGYSGSYGDFYQLYLHNDRRFVTAPGKHLVMPTWNHLWFVAYLWVYSMGLAALFAVCGAQWPRWSAACARLLAGWRLLLLPTLLLALGRLTLLDRFPSTHGLFDDWSNHYLYVSVFLLGALLARERGVWAAMDAQRFVALGTALAVWAVLRVYFSLPDDLVPASTMAWLKPLQRVVYALGQWSAIVAACGFAHRHLSFDSPKRRYLTEAVFPVYIVHQTLIIVLFHIIKPVRLAPLGEALVLIVLTLCASFAIFECVRRVAVLRPLFGLGPRATLAHGKTGDTAPGAGGSTVAQASAVAG